MSGIVGIWNLDGRPVERGLLGRLSAPLAHRGPDGEGLWVEGPAGFACQLLRVTPESATESQPLVSSSRAVLVFDGRLDNREELLAALQNSPGICADSPDPALVLAAYETFGDRFPERLNGDFALGLYDPRRQQLLLARDALGVRPLYYCRAGDTFLFASEIKAVLAHPQVHAEPNDDVLAAYLLFRLGGRFQDPQGATLFEGVFGLLPGCMAILTLERFLTRRYWDFDPSRQTRLGCFEEYAEAFRQHFEQAVRRRLRSAYPVVVSVSGGLDSSSIFCLGETLRRREPERVPRLFGLSYAPSDGSAADESSYLSLIERDYGLAIERLPRQDCTGVVERCRAATWQAEIPFVDVEWNTFHTLRQRARQSGARLLLTGQWGDQMLCSQAYWVDLLTSLSWPRLLSHLLAFHRGQPDGHTWQRFGYDLLAYQIPDGLAAWLRRLRAKLMPHYLDRPWYTDSVRRRARRHSAQQTAISWGAFPTTHARSLYHTAKSRYYGMQLETENKLTSMYGLDIAYPFLDRDLVSFLMTIPGEVVSWRGVQKAILRQAMRGALPDGIVRRAGKGDWTQQENVSMMQLYPQLIRHFRSDGLALRRGYLKRSIIQDELEQLRDRIRGPNCEVTWSLADLLGLELWLQAFWSEKSSHCEAAA